MVAGDGRRTESVVQPPGMRRPGLHPPDDVAHRGPTSPAMSPATVAGRTSGCAAGIDTTTVTHRPGQVFVTHRPQSRDPYAPNISTRARRPFSQRTREYCFPFSSHSRSAGEKTRERRSPISGKTPSTEARSEITMPAVRVSDRGRSGRRGRYPTGQDIANLATGRHRSQAGRTPTLATDPRPSAHTAQNGPPIKPTCPDAMRITPVRGKISPLWAF